MTTAQYLIESNQPLVGGMLPLGGPQRQLRIRSRDLAVSLAAKNFIVVQGQEIRVVHEPTGEIVYRKRGGRPAEVAGEEA